MDRRPALLLVLLSALLVPNSVDAQCSLSAFSQKEARSLLEVIPDALAARHLGGKLSVVDWDAGSNYRTDFFYLYEVLSTKSPPLTPLDNGVLGYFGVNKSTGEVVELNSASNPVQGMTLSKMQESLRAKHCVPHQLIVRNQDIPLEK
jgi:hypothetical protein